MHPNKIVNEDIEQIIAANLDWKQFEGKTILVSGANGFLPAYMVETLLHLKSLKIVHNLKVIALVRNKEKATKKFAHHVANASLSLLVQDVCSPLQINEPLHFIIHAASQASPKYYGTDPVGTLSANVIGTWNLLELAKVHQVKTFLFFSTGDVYGNVAPSVTHIKENDYGYTDPTSLRSCYGESKRMGENMCISFAHQYNLEAKIVRIFHTYGPGMELNDGRVFADFVKNILQNEDIVMQSDGLASRAFCYLSDAITGIFTILLKGENCKAYNMGNPNAAINIINLAEKLVALFPERNLQVVRKERAKDDCYIPCPNQQVVPDVTELNKLGWYPKIDIEEGFKRTILSYL